MRQNNRYPDKCRKLFCTASEDQVKCKVQLKKMLCPKVDFLK